MRDRGRRYDSSRLRERVAQSNKRNRVGGCEGYREREWRIPGESRDQSKSRLIGHDCVSRSNDSLPFSERIPCKTYARLEIQRALLVGVARAAVDADLLQSDGGRIEHDESILSF